MANVRRQGRIAILYSTAGSGGRRRHVRSADGWVAGKDPQAACSRPPGGNTGSTAGSARPAAQESSGGRQPVTPASGTDHDTSGGKSKPASQWKAQPAIERSCLKGCLKELPSRLLKYRRLMSSRKCPDALILGPSRVSAGLRGDR